MKLLNVKIHRIFFPVELFILIATANSVLGATQTWSGTATVNWNAVNGFGTVPANNDLLVFGADGTVGAAASDVLNNNITGLIVGTAAASSSGVTFNSGAPAYTINGNLLNIGLTSGTVTFVNNGTANQTFGTAFNVNGGVNFGLNATSGNLTMNGVVGGMASGNALILSGTASTTNFLKNTANTYAGQSQINSGAILNVVNLSVYGTAGSLGNRALSSDSYGGVMGLIFNGGGTLQYTGSGAQTTDRMLRIGAAATFDASGVTSADTVYFSAHVQNNIAQTAAARTITLTGSNTGTNTFAADLLDNAGVNNLAKTGAGTWIYSGNNNAGAVAADTAAKGSATTRTTDGGTFSVSAGLLKLTGDNSLRTGGSTISGTGTLNFNNNNALSTGTVTISAAGAALQAGAAGLSVANAISTSVSSVGGSGGGNIDANGNTVTLSGVISGAGGITSAGTSGTINLNNTGSTYSGNLDITKGILNVASLNAYGANGPLGNVASSVDSASAVMHLILEGGTLQYAGSSGVAQTTDRMIRIGSGTAAIDASGATTADTVSFTATVENNLAAAAGSRTLTLAGNNAGNNTFAGSMFDRAGGSSSISKTGNGTWVYSGNNNAAAQTLAVAAGSSSTCAGTFSVSAGTLILTGDNSVRTGSATMSANATMQLQANGGNTSSSISTALGGSQALTFGNNSTLQLRGNSSVAFNPASIGGFNNIPVNFDVNNVSSGSGQTLSLLAGGTVNFANALTINVTGGNSYILGLGTIQAINNAIPILTLNPTTASVTLAGFTQSETASGITATLALGGTDSTGNSAVTGVIANGTTSTGTAPVTAVTKSNTGSWVLQGVNTYSGNTTISGGTLALGSSGSINNTPQISIATGATYDVSAISSYTLSSSTTMNASGTASAASIKGASGGTVNLGSQAITLTYDGSHPALTISQGTLSLNGNAFTVNKASALASGTYVIAQQTSGNIIASGSFTVSGTAIDSSHYGTVSVSGGNVNLTVALKPTVTGKTYSRAPGVSYKIYASDLAATATVDSSLGYTATFDHCASTTANNVTLGNNGQSGNSVIILYPSSTANSGDSFSYTINDGHGGTVSGTVTITINNNVTGQATINLAGQTATLGFFGIPGYHYVVQRSVDSLNNWQDLISVTTSNVTPSGTSVDGNGVITAPSGGAFTVTDPSPPSNPTSVYYRLRAAP